MLGSTGIVQIVALLFSYFLYQEQTRGLHAESPRGMVDLSPDPKSD